MAGRLGVFARAARWLARRAGSGVAFALALATVAAWLLAGPFFGFSDTWQLAINTGTTVVTFLMVFLIQNAQTRDTEALQVKLDELIRAVPHARNALLDLEELPEGELHRLQLEYEGLAERARRHRQARRRASARRGRRPKPEQAAPPKRLA